MKKPVLSNSLPGILIEIGKNNGIIFSKNQEILIQKIRELIPKKEELIKIGLKGFNLVKNKYIWSNIIKKLKAIMIDLIKIKMRN